MDIGMRLRCILEVHGKNADNSMYIEGRIYYITKFYADSLYAYGIKGETGFTWLNEEQVLKYFVVDDINERFDNAMGVI